MTRSDNPELNDPQSLYAAWHADVSEPGSREFEELCARYPQYRTELRELHSKYARVEALLGPDPSVDGVESSATSREPFDALVARLHRRRPPESRYEERGEVGRGGMGSILEVFDGDLRRSVAKKVMLESREASPSDSPTGTTLLGRFCEEAQVTAQLTHPGVVPVHELGIDDRGRVFFTMDLVRGRTLQQVFDIAREEREGWNLARAVGVIERVCQTLAFAHAKGVIHRDIKPGNIMVGAFGEVYVMDWGLAKLVGAPDSHETSAEEAAQASPPEDAVSTDRRDASDRDTFAGVKTEAGTAAGTPGFMAPEQARGDVSSLDERSDVYAVGALLYALLTGAKPFAKEIEEGDIVSLLGAMRKGAFAPLLELAPEAPLELVSIAERAMAAAPGERYTNAETMAADLRAWLEGRVVAAHERGAWAELRKWVKRNRALALALLVAFVGVSGGAIGMAVFERNGRLGVERQRLIGYVSAAPTQASGLLAETETLWPALPDRVPTLERWLEEQEELAGRRELLEDALAVLQGEDSSFSPGELDARLLERLLAASSRMHELDQRASWMRERLAMASTVRESTIDGVDARRRWEAAIDAIRISDKYSGLVITPQLGLLPLRQDPLSGLWEFWHSLSGPEPVFDSATDRWAVDESTGVILVLIPGGTTRVGAPNLPETDPLYDEFSWLDHEQSNPPTHEVSLAPYFIAKYELSQGQWRRARGTNASQGRAGSEIHPADTVSWDDAVETLGRFDLVLPTEAQWEVAARGGTGTRFHTGHDPRTLKGHAVLYPEIAIWDSDEEAVEDTPIDVWGVPWRSHHEPVGTTLPNQFGLHEVHGNVWEWCLDVYDVASAPREGDGLRMPSEPLSPLRVMRGGSYSGQWSNSRVTFRYPWERQNREPDTGVRPARALR